MNNKIEAGKKSRIDRPAKISRRHLFLKIRFHVHAHKLFRGPPSTSEADIFSELILQEMLKV